MKKYKGFTLIELMIVVAILGIIAAIILPYVLGTNENSCNITTPSKDYIGVDKSTIKETEESLYFTYYGKNVKVNKYSVDTSCN